MTNHSLSGGLAGSIFKVTLSGTFTTVDDFISGPAGIGDTPDGELVLGTDGNLYGTTFCLDCGSQNGGVAFQLSTSGAIRAVGTFEPQTFTGTQPSPLILGANGVLWGGVNVTSPNPSVDLFKITDMRLAPPRGEVALAGPAGSDGSLTLQWNPVPGATSYIVKLVDLTTSTRTVIATVTGTSYVVTGLTNGTGYGFTVTSVDSMGPGVDGDEIVGYPAHVQ